MISAIPPLTKFRRGNATARLRDLRTGPWLPPEYSADHARGRGVTGLRISEAPGRQARREAGEGGDHGRGADQKA